MNFQTKWNIGQEPPCLPQQLTRRLHEVIFIFAANAAVRLPFPQYERKNEEEAAALGQPSGWRWRKDAEVWLPCEHYLDVDLVKKMNDHTYCMLHNKKGEASVSGRRRQVRDRRRHKRRINIGAALPKWKSVKVANGFQNNTDVAFFLLDRWVSLSSTGLMNIWRKRWFLN